MHRNLPLVWDDFSLKSLSRILQVLQENEEINRGSVCVLAFSSDKSAILP